MKRKIEIEHGQVLDTVANVCQVDVKRLCMKPCRGGFTVLLGRTRSLGRYNGKKCVFTLTQFGESLMDVSSDARQIFDRIDRLEAAIKAAPATTRTAPGARINAMTVSGQAETRVSVSSSTKANIGDILSGIVRDFVINRAKERLGDGYNDAVKFALMLGSMSRDAKAGQIDKLVPANGGGFESLFNLYYQVERDLGRAFIGIIAPDALSADDFVYYCSKATTHATISPACPACGAQTLNLCTDYASEVVAMRRLSVICECLTCGLSPTLEISFE